MEIFKFLTLLKMLTMLYFRHENGGISEIFVQVSKIDKSNSNSYLAFFNAQKKSKNAPHALTARNKELHC